MTGSAEWTAEEDTAYRQGYAKGIEAERELILRFLGKWKSEYYHEFSSQVQGLVEANQRDLIDEISHGNHERQQYSQPIPFDVWISSCAASASSATLQAWNALRTRLGHRVR